MAAALQTPPTESHAEWIVGPEQVPPALPKPVTPPAAAPSPRMTGPATPAKPARDTRPADRRTPRRGRGKAVRPARPREPEAVVGGVDPEQAHARKGVCSAYFINQECWRVPDAYCNTALQICAIRNCPVYHLHQESLERRFARKFKHLW